MHLNLNQVIPAIQNSLGGIDFLQREGGEKAS
jgi:hypothetical protein